MTPCTSTTPGKACTGFWPGHLMHVTHGSQVGRTPWGWRDGVVAGVDGLAITVTYLDDSASPVLWHHRDLSDVVRVGAPVRVHERFHALGCPAGWFNCVVENGAGAVPEPTDAAVWDAEVTRGVVDLSTGIAVAVDRAAEDRV